MRWDFKCPVCGHTIELTFDSFDTMKAETRASKMWCSEGCNAPMERQPSAPSFSIKGYCANNGYSGGST